MDIGCTPLFELGWNDPTASPREVNAAVSDFLTTLLGVKLDLVCHAHLPYLHSVSTVHWTYHLYLDFCENM